ncbi:MAG: hypothetical protein B7Z08_08295 [Sphingomonadales bacterium 32-68-7]|nr:MAG: hypothetical protein B7Z33_10085 [Sphingomonadales bacterium 12-68-11]OYX08712.1 MAG: hypothetical protein B7Z08_08295 [Sphingomonadales bacterium 32-68-7]
MTTANPTPTQGTFGSPPGGGECARLILQHDWTATPLGPIANWPQSLVTATAMMLASPVPMVMLWGADGYMLYNDAYSVFAGGRHPRLLGSKVREGWPEVADFNDNVMKVGLAGGVLSYRDQELTLFREGVPEQVWMNLDYSPVPDESGAPAGVLCILQETTERMAAERQRSEAEASLRAETERVQLALDAGAIVGTWVWDVAADRLTSDERFARSFGLDIELCRTGLPLDRVMAPIHDDDRALVAETIAQAVAQGGPYRCEYRVRQPDGAYYWVEANGRVELDTDGKAARFPGVLLDIEQRQAAAAALRESEARYRTLFESIESGFCVVEVDLPGDAGRIDYRVLEANPAFYEHTGFREAIVGKWLREAAPALEEHWYEIYGRVARTGMPERLEQGSEMLGRWFDVYAFRVGAPEHCRVAILFNDISARRAAEDALRDLNDTLEKRVAERSAELEQAHEQLRQSQKLEAMGQLTGGVAHDFNNLLTPIVAVLDRLQRQGLGGEREQRLIAGAMQSAERAKTLVQRLLAIARRQPLRPVAVDVSALIAEMTDLLASTTGPQISLVIAVADRLPPALADPNQLEMAILNLAVNARDAMPNGGTLRISAGLEVVAPGERADLPAGEYVRLAVADTGTGMDEATLRRAAEPFFSTKEVGKGTGLGLSMVHGLVTQLSGALSIGSAAGIGTNVDLWLPTGEAPESATAADPGNLVKGEGLGTALLVDDEDLVRASTADMLTELGYTVTEASSAEQALELLERGFRPDVLVTDHLMPGMNGTDLALALQAEQPKLRVLVVSGYLDQVERAAPHLPQLTKPFRIHQLAAALAGEPGAEP